MGAGARAVGARPTAPGASTRDATPDVCCPQLHATVELVGRRWTGAILFVLLTADRPLRFGELRDGVPQLSDRLLTARLRELESHGLVEPADAAPGYVPTPKARELRPALDALQAWGRRWML